MYRWEEFGRVIVDDGKRNGYEGFSEHDQTSGRSRPGEATFTFIIEKQKKTTVAALHMSYPSGACTLDRRH